MANGQLNRILRRRPEVDEAEFELLQSRVLARLQGDSVVDSSAADAEAPSEALQLADDVSVDEVADTAVAVMAEPESDAWREPVPVMTMSIEAAVPGDHESPIAVEAELDPAAPWEAPEVAAPDEVPDTLAVPDTLLDADTFEAIESPEAVGATAPAQSSPAFDMIEDEPPVTVAAAEMTEIEHLPDVAVAPDLPRNVETAVPTPTPMVARARSASSRSVPPPHAAAAVAGPAPYCPYCALLLEPPPETSRRCPRCRERIVVKRVGGRSVYLTEASLAIFDAERRRVANSGRWTRERSRWLKAAASVSAPAEKIARLERAPLSDEVVASARTLYLTTVDRSFRAAKRERRWDDASRIMRDHAITLFKLAGSPIPPPADSLDAHRLGAAAALRGIGEMSRVAELVSASCCETCRADDGGLFKIAVELRQPRLPHAGCPKGLCRCDWYLAVRDQTAVRRHLRRRARTESAVRSST